MAGKFNIMSGTGEGYKADVSSRGELAVAPISYSDSYNAAATSNNIPVNLVVPATNQIFVITSITLYANQSVNNIADATVTLYEATSPSSSTISKTLYITNMVRADRVSLTNLHLKVNVGKWVNLLTTDATVYGTILGYYTKP